MIEDEASDAFLQVSNILGRYGQNFTTKQKADIANQIGGSPNGQARPKKASGEKKAVAQKYRLPHTQETWSGRGRTPRSFAAWEGTAAYKEWKSKHTDEKFPAYPGCFFSRPALSRQSPRLWTAVSPERSAEPDAYKPDSGSSTLGSR